MKRKLEVLILVLGVIGLIGTIAATAMPMWRVSAFIGANLIVMETLWEGLWMDCYYEVIRMQCKVYDSMLILPPELQASRALMSAAVALAVVSVVVTATGLSKGRLGSDDVRARRITLAFGGVLFLLSSVSTLIPVSWVGYTVIADFYNPTVIDARKRELGSALFVGWATSAILLVTGILLLASCSKSREEEPYAGVHLMPLKDEGKEESASRAPSSFHKHQEYV
ncbi:claudin-17-like [Betta splendens]|uniref:Claudin n=1 Tax=Betta splendens TaxID=158456 RepID=A0A6P7PHM0_BETSP|nr:claudin-17-like [Betta splendens]